jgi:hypothetical protein
MSLPFVHTARRYYRLNGLAIPRAYILLCLLCHCWDGVTGTWLKPVTVLTYFGGLVSLIQRLTFCLTSYHHLPSPLPPPYPPYVPSRLVHLCSSMDHSTKCGKISGSNYDSLKGSQMPHRRLMSDAHEWMINEIPAVPIYYLAKPQPKGTSLAESAGKEDPVGLDSSLTL